MRIIELIENLELKEGGASGPIRYNSEVGMLVGLLGIDTTTFDPANPETTLSGANLDDPQKVFADIKKFLAPNFDHAVFSKWAQKGSYYSPLVLKQLEIADMSAITLGWAGGSNKSSKGAADISFEGVNALGISIKAEGGITLANLTPKALGLTPAKGSDIFYHYAQPEFVKMKTDIFNAVLAAAKGQPDKPLDPYGRGKYTITFNSATQKFTCTGKKNIEATEQQILGSVAKNSPWQRVFGDWFQLNYQANRGMAEPLYSKLSVEFEKTIEEYLSSSGQLTKILQFAAVPYFYASNTGLYYVPGIDSVSDIQVMGIKYGRIGEDNEQPNGTSQLFTASIGKPDSKETAEIDIYIRYANGMFEANPTVRVQNLRNPQFMSWVKLN